MEKTRHPYSKALQELPTYTVGDQVWERILTWLNDPSDKLPNQVISELPTHRSMDRWSAIEQELNRARDLRLGKALLDLPQYKLDKDLFSQSLPSPKTYFINLPRPIQMSIAASIIVLLSLGFVIWNHVRKPQVEYTYLEEVIQPPLTAFAQISDQEDNILLFIKSNCTAYALKCSDPEFLGLLDQYQELQKAEQKLSEEILQNNNPTQLTKYLIRITKEKSEVGKSLIHYLLS